MIRDTREEVSIKTICKGYNTSLKTSQDGTGKVTFSRSLLIESNL